MGVRLTVLSSSSAPGASADAAPPASESWEFAHARIVLGRGSGADVILPHPSVSVRHASLEADGVRYTITDHGSLNGTWVNGQRIVSERKKPLRDGDRIDVGLFALRFAANVPVNDVPSREGTAAIARRLLRSARAHEPGAGRRLTITNGPHAGRVHELPPAPARIVLGRADTAEVPLADADASREHAEIVVDAEGALVRDLASKNGVFVDATRVTERRLRDRDEIRIGATLLVFEEPERAAADADDRSLRALERLPDEPAPPPSLPPPPASAEGPPPRQSQASPAPAPAPPDELASLAPSEAGAQPAPSEPNVTPAPAPRSRLGTIEWVVYALALAVFAASLAGLWWLLRGG